MEAEKPPSLPPPRKASGVFQSQFKARELGEPTVQISVGKREEAMRCPSSRGRQEKRRWIPPSSAFFSMQDLNGLEGAYATGEGHLLY